MAPPLLRLDYVELDELLAAPRNPKQHNEPGIVASINRHGFIDPVIRDERTKMLVGGHGRVDALREMRDRSDPPPDRISVDSMGAWLVPTVTGWASENDADAEHALIALNGLTMNPGWDPEGLAAMLSGLQEQPYGLEGTGFSDGDLSELLGSINFDDPRFRPGTDGPPRLDQRAPITCPECGAEFMPPITTFDFQE